MIKKIFFVFALALILQLISGCVDCNCGPIKTIYFTKKGLSLKNMDASLPQPMVTNAGIISSANYGIQIQLLTEQIALRKQRINWGLMQTAHACSCSEDNFIAKEDILSIEIFSNNDFDASHPKNTDLSLYFKAKRYTEMVSIADYIKSLKDFNGSSVSAFYEGIFLQVKPTSSKKHKFKVRITLSDGRILETETTEVELS
ncbi:DUF5034 domain-containing protein [Pedobacter polaris]|uniref:DUF5034 domain-containing protein n=1 Tax=Pedobacter polaris TaxID=2571273 RepID=A0A4U1CVP1_9SPHI|nr:DUF5034 domain-containing protein [Pedobacter polaris]TKC12265.1 DUF5034 domain-containing protein [Pedobacter polaris]